MVHWMALAIPFRRRSVARCKRSFSVETVVSPETGLTDNQLDFYNVAKAFSDQNLKPFASEWDAKSIFPTKTFQKLAELGLGGMMVNSDVGGSELSRLDTVIVIEALAAGCVSTTAMLTIHNACTNMVDKFGTEQQRQEWAKPMSALNMMGSFCLTEPGSGSDASSIVTRAEVVDGHYIINGGKAFTSGAGLSELYLVACRTGGVPGAGGITCIAVPLGTPGLSFGQNENKMGWKCQPTRQVLFEDVRVPLSNRIGAEGEGFRIAMAGLDGGRLSIGACSLGAAQTCLELAVAYVKERKQFGRPIADFQATQFRLADMAGKVASSRLALRHAAQLLDSKHPAATAHCAMAKQMATDYGFEVCNEALQLHGGYGYLKEYQVERFVRDCRVHQILEGTNEIMRHIVGRAIVA